MPTIVFEGDEKQMFNLRDIEIATQLDGTRTPSCANYILAVSNVIALYWTFDIAFNKKLLKTLSFLAGYVCGLQEFKCTPALQKVLNMLSD